MMSETSKRFNRNSRERDQCGSLGGRRTETLYVAAWPRSNGRESGMVRTVCKPEFTLRRMPAIDWKGEGQRLYGWHYGHLAQCP
uniref:Uncharacterized protein n=1 Tax=Ascaris lumbricoides TaxID=6252 RepID=A0A0M3HR44_ASCLU